MNSPFNLENQTEYSNWREYKLSQYPTHNEKLLVKFHKNVISKSDVNLIKELIKKYNFALYEFESVVSDKELYKFCSKLGLEKSISNLLSDADNISNITNQEGNRDKISG